VIKLNKQKMLATLNKWKMITIGNYMYMYMNM